MEEVITFWSAILHSQPFLLALSVVAFYASQLLYSRIKLLFLHPLLISSLIVIGVLSALDIEYKQYNEANGVLNLLLNISVVCLSYLMYKNVKRIKDYKLSLLLSTFIGSIVGVVSVIGLCYAFGCEEIIMLSMQPKSVTSAIAVSISENVGGIPALTSLAVVVTGISGSIIGPKILQLFRINDPVARGAALGSASHAIGTARALELGAVEGAIGGASICLMGLFTSIVIPIINQLR